MTAAILIQERTPMTVRTALWLTGDQRTELAERITGFLASVEVLPQVAVPLSEVLTELGVAQARAHVWPAAARHIRLVAGYSADMLPIRISDRERHVLSCLHDLSEDLRTAIERTP